MKHPMQDVIIDTSGRPRFRRNDIVRYLLDEGPFDMNSIASLPFSQEDQEQFAQLIGYSVSGYGELPYVSDRSYNMAERRSKKAKPDPGKEISTVGSGVAMKIGGK